jgi:hypothetical protein
MQFQPYGMPFCSDDTQLEGLSNAVDGFDERGPVIWWLALPFPKNCFQARYS